MARRILWLHTLWGLFALLILGRLVLVMLIPDALPKAGNRAGWLAKARVRAEFEHLRVVQVDDGRGRILYRNGCPWSGEKRSVQVTSFPHHSALEHRENKPTHASTVIGRVGKPDSWKSVQAGVQEFGRSGLEFRFNDTLNSRHPGYVAMVKDAKGNLEPSLGTFSLSPKKGYDVRTTVDRAWQARIEQIVTRASAANVAIVVLDTDTNEIRAMAGKDGENHHPVLAVHSETPGSVFKLVTAAAAHETYVVRPSSPFRCDGTSKLPGVHMSCWKVHGDETFDEALANSCDVTFASVGVKLGRPVLTKMAVRLGLDGTGLQTVRGRAVLAEAEKGSVFKRPGSDDGLLANTAIGQEDARISPLQGALLASTVANRGLYRNAILVSDAEQNGVKDAIYPRDDWRRAYSTYTAQKLAREMRLVVTLPTGTAYQIDRGLVRAAVKTGTAELKGVHLGHVNAWMVGFAPYTKPEIAFSVFVGNASSERAHRVVRQIVRELLSAYKQFHGESIIS